MNTDIDVEILVGDDQRENLERHRLCGRYCYNGMLIVCNEYRDAGRKMKNRAFQMRKKGSGFERCSSYVARWAADEAAAAWYDYKRGHTAMPKLRPLDWPYIRFGRVDLPIKIRYGVLHLPRAFGGHGYELVDVDQDFDFSIKFIEIEKKGDDDWRLRGWNQRPEREGGI